MVKPPPLSQQLFPRNSENRRKLIVSALSLEGTFALPYLEEDRLLISQQLLSLSDAYPTLRLRTANFTHNDGHSVNLLQAVGTIPPHDNIPIIIWLMECYPRFPPLVFVAPRTDTIINPQNPFVSLDGAVSILYLKNWAYSSSNLVELALNLSRSFEFETPLHSKHDYYEFMDSISSMVLGFPLVDEDDNSISRNTTTGTSNCNDTASSSPEEKEREVLADKLYRDMVELRERREGEMEVLVGAQGVLRHREEELGKTFSEMLEEKNRLQQELQLVLLNGEALKGWLKENEEKLSKVEVKLDEEKGIDQALEPCDRLSRQILDCSASDLAIEDSIDAMDKALQEGSIPFNQYLKYIRSLSREQFFHRATASKARDAQMQVKQLFKPGFLCR